MKTPEESVKDFIEKTIVNERGKWDIGRKNNLYAWESYKKDFERMCRDIEYSKERYQSAESFITDMGLWTTFNSWKEAKK